MNTIPSTTESRSAHQEQQANEHASSSEVVGGMRDNRPLIPWGKWYDKWRTGSFMARTFGAVSGAGTTLQKIGMSGGWRYFQRQVHVYFFKKIDLGAEPGLVQDKLPARFLRRLEFCHCRLTSSPPQAHRFHFSPTLTRPPPMTLLASSRLPGHRAGVWDSTRSSPRSVQLFAALHPPRRISTIPSPACPITYDRIFDDPFRSVRRTVIIEPTLQGSHPHPTSEIGILSSV